MDDYAIADRLESIMVNTADGRRSVADDRRYAELRNTLLSRGVTAPSLVATHPTLDSLSAALKRSKTKAERIRIVRDEMERFLLALKEQQVLAVDAAIWTGIEGRAAKAKLVRSMLPLAQSAVDNLIDTLSEPNANNAPILDSRVEAIDELRKLHQALGELLIAAEQGHLDDELGLGLQAEIARFGKRSARLLRDDPAPYLSSALLLALFTAIGIPGLGNYLSGIALKVQKNRGR